MDNIDIRIDKNVYNLNLEDLITVGNRINNSKRNFLFISKVLGKHIEIKPEICKKTGELLSSLLNEDDKKHGDKEVCVLGFAETATGLGMAVASTIENSYYITTTREDIIEVKSPIKFEEEHSHATTHKCFLEDVNKLLNAEKIIIVDDEITTGKSILNIVKELKKYCTVKKVIVLTILDFRVNEDRKRYIDFSKEESIDVEVLSLISGEVKINNTEVFYDNNDDVLNGQAEVINMNLFKRKNLKTLHCPEVGESYLCDTGRFGVAYKDIQKIEEYAKDAAAFIHDKIGYPGKILVLGHGENIYIPSRIASFMQGDVVYKSTTRSPIYCIDKEGYPIRQKNVFYHKGVKYYFYNKDIIEKTYDKVILLTEDDLNIKLVNNITIFKI